MPGLSARRLLLYANTLRHLRLRQWVFQPIRRLQRHRPPRAVPAEAVSQERVRMLRDAARDWWPADDREAGERCLGVLSGRFRFLGVERRFDTMDWRTRHVSHLWSYQLHGFGFARDLARASQAAQDPALAARFAACFVELATSWVEQTADGRGDGWEPYPISVRVANWVYALVLLDEALDQRVKELLYASLHRQLAFLARRLEWHILANHLQKNFTALYVGSLLFDGPQASRWRRVAREGMWAQLREQVLPDGGHYERSPMYHALALQDFLEAASAGTATGDAPPDEARARLRLMVSALHVLVRPDGALHLLNDAAEGMAPPASFLGRWAATLGLGDAAAQPPRALPLTGYFTHETERGDRLIVDCGAPGPAYQPGHGHCDLLSFELDLAGRQVVVDSGVHGYDGDPFREYVRSTRAHNTVMIAGREQSELWGTFRMARRATVEGARATMAGTTAAGDRTRHYRFEGSYRPFHDGRALHRRRIEFFADELVVTDLVEGAPGARLESFVHFHPDATLIRAAAADGAAGSDFRASWPGGASPLVVEPFGVDEVEEVRGAKDPVQGWYCPEFGKAIEQSVLVLRVRANAGKPFGYRIRWNSPDAVGPSTMNPR